MVPRFHITTSVFSVLMLCIISGVCARKPYMKKSPYQAFGQQSPKNGKIKMNPVSGHLKRNSKGSYTLVNP